jgi:transcriptional regulator with XRE-family HTH domain
VSATPATFGARVRQCREDLGLTRGELAERIHVTTTALAQWEVDRTHPYHDIYPRLATALQCTIDYLMTGRAS